MVIQLQAFLGDLMSKEIHFHHFEFTFLEFNIQLVFYRNPILRECEDETHTPKVGTWESSGTPKTSEFNCRGQNTSHWGVLYIIGKLTKCKCWKWARMGHLDICSTSYGKKKGRESNWQFDSRLLKAGNWLNTSACRWSAIHHWKALKESYKFVLDFNRIGGLNKKLWPRKVPRVQIGTVSKLLLGSLETKSHSDVGAIKRHKIYYMGEGCGFPWVRAMVNHVSLKLPVACPSTKGALENELTNLLVGLMKVRINK